MARATKTGSVKGGARRRNRLSVASPAAKPSTRKGRTADPSVASRLPPMTEGRVRKAKKKFEEGVLKRGEASPAGEPLERGATHEIVGHREDGTPILKRRRFSVA